MPTFHPPHLPSSTSSYASHPLTLSHSLNLSEMSLPRPPLGPLLFVLTFLSLPSTLPQTHTTLRSPPPSLLLLPVSYPLPSHTSSPLHLLKLLHTLSQPHRLPSPPPSDTSFQSVTPFSCLHTPLSSTVLTHFLESPPFLTPTTFTSPTPLTHTPHFDSNSHSCTQFTLSQVIFELLGFGEPSFQPLLFCPLLLPQIPSIPEGQHLTLPHLDFSLEKT